MIKKIWQLLRKLIISVFILYGYNLIAVKFNLVIPINFITIPAVAFFGFPMLFVLVLMRVLIF